MSDETSGGIRCRNTTMYEHDCHPAYARRYDGYCLECANAGVPELIDQRDELLAEVERLRAEANELRREVFAGLWAVSKDEAATLTDAQYRAMLGRLRQQWGMAPTGPDSDGGEAD